MSYENNKEHKQDLAQLKKGARGLTINTRRDKEQEIGDLGNVPYGRF